MYSNFFIPTEGARIGLFGKGGAGRSTVCVLLARALREHGLKVAVLDADATNVGLHHAFGIPQPPRPLLGLLGGAVFTGGAVTCPVDDPVPLEGGQLELSTLDPAYVAQTGEGIYLLTGGR